MSDSSVGYKKPPVHTQFQKGQSGNLKGRPKGSKSFNSILEKMLRKRVSITENGQQRQVEMIEAMALRLVQKAVGGDIKALQYLMNWKAQADERTPPEPLGPMKVTFVRWKEPFSSPDLSILTDRELVCYKLINEKLEAHQQGLPIPVDKYGDLRYLTDEEVEQKFRDAAEKFKQTL
jgi:hypothetical protein